MSGRHTCANCRNEARLGEIYCGPCADMFLAMKERQEQVPRDRKRVVELLLALREAADGARRHDIAAELAEFIVPEVP